MVDRTKYVVLDVETNGLSSERYDLLSISIYKPDDEKSYNKFLPLEKGEQVFTTMYNGITIETLKDATPLTQLEVDDLIKEFEIKDRTVLTYGDLDKKFIKEYFKRKKLKGFNKFSFFNYKENIYSSSFQGGNVTKDNLCNLYGIENVKEVHSGLNDCVLEWKLFEKMDMNKLIVIDDNVFEYNENYILPVSYIMYCNKLKKKIPLPVVGASKEPIYEMELDKTKLRKFPSNMSGVAIEHVINSIINAKKLDSSKEILENLSKLKYIGTLPSAYDKIQISKNSDGTLVAKDEEDREIINDINEVSIYIRETIGDFIDTIKLEIFKNEDVYSQELVINNEYKLLALCDLSNEHAVIEIKTWSNLNINYVALQLYIQSNNRPTYLLYIDWEKNSIKLDKIKFEFGEKAQEVISNNQAVIDAKEQESIQKNFFEKKQLELILYSHGNTISEIKCKKCLRRFKVKSKLTSTVAASIKCPYCNPSDYPGYLERITSTLGNYRWKTIFLKNITITNWVLNEEVYVKCKNCGHEWCDTIRNVLKDKCLKC